jgi:hypothetical protein
MYAVLATKWHRYPLAAESSKRLPIPRQRSNYPLVHIIASLAFLTPSLTPNLHQGSATTHTLHVPTFLNPLIHSAQAYPVTHPRHRSPTAALAASHAPARTCQRAHRDRRTTRSRSASCGGRCGSSTPSARLVTRGRPRDARVVTPGRPLTRGS